MARKRMLDPKIWDSEQVMKLSPKGFKLYIYLISQADDGGKLALCYQLLLSRVFPFGESTIDEIKKMVTEMDTIGLIIAYVVADKEYIKHPNWTRYQKIDRPTESSIPDPIPLVEGSSKARRRLVRNGIEVNRIEVNGKENNTVPTGTTKETDFYHHIEQGFLKHNGNKFTNYALEGKAIHELIAKAKARDYEHFEDLLVSVCAQFWKLKQGSEKFWTEKPFLPHILSNKLWDMVLETLRNDEPLSPELEKIAKGDLS